MEREDVLKEISSLLDGRCAVCPMQQERNIRGNKNFAQYDRICLSECEVGKELKQLGVMLDESVRPRVYVDDSKIPYASDWLDIANKNGVKTSTFYYRLAKGMTGEEAALKPIDKSKSRIMAR